jgi:hypothetical protein
MRSGTVAIAVTVCAGVFLAGVGVGQVRPLKFAAYLKPTNTTEMRLAVLETNLDALGAFMPFDHVGTPMLHYWPACQCFRASVEVSDINTLPLDRLRSELLLKAHFPILRLRVAIPELKDSDVYIQFTHLGAEIGTFENGELILK